MKIRTASLRARTWWLVGGAFVLLKLWLVDGQTIYAIGGSRHDDQLFVNLAASILSGEWLGPYHQLTLAKGPMYPLWIAGVFRTGLPLFFAQQLLFAAACAVFVRVLRPWLGSDWIALACFVVLLFHPVSYETVVHSRVVRQDILHSLALFALAGLIALARPDASNSGRLRSCGWSVVAGLAMGAIWLTREETIWFVPLWLGVWLWLVMQNWRELRRLERGVWLRLSLPLLAWAGSVGVVAAINARVYGVWTICEFRSGSFPDAYGALLRVEPPERMLRVPVTRAARERIYAVSPAFAELRPFLEGDIGRSWAEVSTIWTGLPGEAYEIGGGWFMWALRDAVAEAGHGKSATESAAFYRRLADEVNAACDSGHLPALGPRRGFLPPLGWTDVPIIRPWFLAAAGYFFQLRDMQVRSIPSVGTPEEMEFFATVTHGRLTRAKDAPPLPRLQRKLDHFRVFVLERIVRIYQALVVPWGVLALLAWIVVTVRQLRRGLVSIWLVYHLGLFAAIGALCAIHAIICATSFNSIHPGSFTAVYPLWIAFPFTVWAQARSPGAMASTIVS